MTVETVGFIPDLNSSLPTDNDQQSEGAAHIRNLKLALRQSFPGLQDKAAYCNSDDLNMILNIGGQLTGYANIVAWVNENFDTPSARNAAITAVLASSPVLGGTPTRSTAPDPSSNGNEIITSNWVRNLFATRRVQSIAVWGPGVTGTWVTTAGALLVHGVMIGGGGGGGGAGNLAYPTAGGNGDYSQFGDAVCYGGIGGGYGFSTQGVPGAGGSVSYGSVIPIAIACQGGYGAGPVAAGGFYPGGDGADTRFGGRGTGQAGASGIQGWGYGTGGAGGSGYSGAWSPAAGGGGGGMIEFWIPNPQPSYYIRVASAAGGGWRGPNGSAYDGGVGQGGVIYVEAF